MPEPFSSQAQWLCEEHFERYKLAQSLHKNEVVQCFHKDKLELHLKEFFRSGADKFHEQITSHHAIKLHDSNLVYKNRQNRLCTDLHDRAV